MALAAALAACSGSTDSTSPAPTPPIGAIQLGFESPAANVVESGASHGLAVDATLGGRPAPAGTTVTFTVSPPVMGTVAPVAAGTVNGTATTTLSMASPPAGSMFLVSASTTSNSDTASDALTFYVRPAHQAMQVLVPIYPATGSTGGSSTGSTSGTGTGTGSTSTPTPWSSLASSAASYPDVHMIAIANPNAGTLSASTTVDASLGPAITAFKTVPGTSNKVVGYVATASGSSGAISVADVKATIDNYIRLYPGQLDGFFLDSMGTDSAHLSYYQEIHDYIKAIATGLGTTASASPLVIGNPATYPVAAYAGVADMLVTFAGSAAAYASVDPQPANAWVYARDNAAQAAMVHTASTCTDMQNAVKAANTPRMNTGAIYVTNMTSGAPWSALPAYWPQLLATVDALNKQRVLPSC